MTTANIATEFGKTSAQGQALAYLARGPLTVSEALAIGGNVLVRALCQLTKHQGTYVIYSAGAYRLVCGYSYAHPSECAHCQAGAKRAVR
jgi:hypothetical protein